MKSFVRTAVLALALAAPAAGLAQGYRDEEPSPGYRTGLPEVNAPRPLANPEAGNIRAAEGFQRWYARAKRPRIMVFWNREQTDETTTEYAQITTSGAAAVGSAVRVGRPGSPVQWGSAAGAAVAYEETSRHAITGGRYAPMNRLHSAKLEAAFQSAWLRSGVRLVDRAAVMRRVSAGSGKEDRADLQYMESVAFEQKIDYLVEVLPEPDASSPTGYTFMVKVKHLPSATMTAQFNTPATPADGPERIVAAPGGFEKRRDSRNTADNVGAELAFQTMSRFR